MVAVHFDKTLLDKLRGRYGRGLHSPILMACMSHHNSWLLLHKRQKTVTSRQVELIDEKLLWIEKTIVFCDIHTLSYKRFIIIKWSIKKYFKFCCIIFNVQIHARCHVPINFICIGSVACKVRVLTGTPFWITQGSCRFRCTVNEMI